MITMSLDEGTSITYKQEIDVSTNIIYMASLENAICNVQIISNKPKY